MRAYASLYFLCTHNLSQSTNLPKQESSERKIEWMSRVYRLDCHWIGHLPVYISFALTHFYNQLTYLSKEVRGCEWKGVDIASTFWVIQSHYSMCVTKKDSCEFVGNHKWAMNSAEQTTQFQSAELFFSLLVAKEKRDKPWRRMVSCYTLITKL